MYAGKRVCRQEGVYAGKRVCRKKGMQTTGYVNRMNAGTVFSSSCRGQEVVSGLLARGYADKRVYPARGHEGKDMQTNNRPCRQEHMHANNRVYRQEGNADTRVTGKKVLQVTCNICRHEGMQTRGCADMRGYQQ